MFSTAVTLKPGQGNASMSRKRKAIRQCLESGTLFRIALKEIGVRWSLFTGRLRGMILRYKKIILEVIQKQGKKKKRCNCPSIPHKGLTGEATLHFLIDHTWVCFTFSLQSVMSCSVSTSCSSSKQRKKSTDLDEKCCKSRCLYRTVSRELQTAIKARPQFQTSG